MSPEVLKALVVVALAVGLGAFASWRGFLDEHSLSGITKLVVNVLFPCLILGSVIGNTQAAEPAVLFFSPLCGAVIFATQLGLTWLVARHLLSRHKALDDDGKRRSFVLVAGLQNYGYIALPVLDVIFGKQIIAVMLLHNVGVELVLWTLGVGSISGHLDRNLKKHLLNPPVLAILIALALNFLGLAEHVPATAVTAMDMVGRAAIPLGIILCGATIHLALKQESNLWEPRAAVPLVLWGCLLRHGVFAALMIGVACLSFLPVSVRQVLLVEAAMPAAFFPIVLARHYGACTRTAVILAMSSFFLCPFTMGFIISIGRAWTGL